MNSMINTKLRIFLLFLGIVSIFNLYSNAFAAFAQNSSITRPKNLFVPDTNFFDSEGAKLFLDQFEGRTILLCFWATWCGQCAQELPSLDVLQKDFRKLPFEVVAISEDFNGLEIVKNYFSQYDIRHLKLYYDSKNQLFKAMSVGSVPTSFLIDSEGRIKVIFKGDTKWHDDNIRELILSEINGNHPMPKNSYDTTSLNKKVPNDKTSDKTISKTIQKENQNESSK